MRAAVLFFCLTLAACDWEIPITETGTREVVPGLVGDWFLTTNGSRLHIRKYDATHYVLGEGAHGDNLFTAHHSDLGDWQLVSVRQLKPDGDTWTYAQWRLADRDHLEIRVVSEKLVPYDTTDPATVVKLLKEHRAKPELLGPPLVYARAQE